MYSTKQKGWWRNNDLVVHCSLWSSFSWLPERRFFFWWKTPLIAVSTPALYPINHIKWLEKSEREIPKSECLHFWRRNVTFLHFTSLTVIVLFTTTCFISECCSLNDAPCSSVTWERSCRSHKRTSLTLSPVLLLQHLPRDDIFFSSTAPVKVTNYLSCALCTETLNRLACNTLRISWYADLCVACLVKSHQPTCGPKHYSTVC